MNKINYKESIDLNKKIDELLLINIDDNLTTNSDDDFVNIMGEIKISGEVKIEDKQEAFTHSINVNISLSKEQLSREDINITIDDFTYTINDNLIDIDLYLKINGLKEMDACFPPQEDREVMEVEELDQLLDTTDTIDEESVDSTEIETQEIEETQEEIEDIPQEIREENFSLLKQVFKTRSLKKERIYLIHVVKNETSYKQISELYGIDENLIKLINNNKEVESGKLIFIPNSK